MWVLFSLCEESLFIWVKGRMQVKPIRPRSWGELPWSYTEGSSYLSSTADKRLTLHPILFVTWKANLSHCFRKLFLDNQTHIRLLHGCHKPVVLLMTNQPSFPNLAAVFFTSWTNDTQFLFLLPPWPSLHPFFTFLAFQLANCLLFCGGQGSFGLPFKQTIFPYFPCSWPGL